MENGFIRDILDVKVLVLYVLKLADRPLELQRIYELCYVDNRLTYFDICEVLPQLVASGHAEELPGKLFAITEKGLNNIEITANSLAYTLRSKAAKAVAEDLAEAKKGEFISASLHENGDLISAAVELKDNFGPLMKLELAAPDKAQARKLSAVLQKNAAYIYKAIMDDIMQELDETGTD